VVDTPPLPKEEGGKNDDTGDYEQRHELPILRRAEQQNAKYETDKRDNREHDASEIYVAPR
jgi:hypothetical protein